MTILIFYQYIQNRPEMPNYHKYVIHQDGSVMFKIASLEGHLLRQEARDDASCTIDDTESVVDACDPNDKYLLEAFVNKLCFSEKNERAHDFVKHVCQKSELPWDLRGTVVFYVTNAGQESAKKWLIG